MLGRCIAVSFAVIVAGPSLAAAEVNRCATADTDVAYAGTDITELAGDTGWFPSGFVAQLRLTARVQGHTNVAAGYQARGCWDGDMEAGLAGRAESGYFDVAYGADVHLYGRIHTTILGYTYNWEGEIKLPYIPNDLMLEGTTVFNPRLDTGGVSVSDATSPITLLSTDTLSNIISIAGISGGLRVTMTPSMTSTYRATKTSFNGSTVDAEADRIAIEQPGTGFHSTLQLPLAVDGKVRYAPTLTFAATFDVSILGYRVVDWHLGSVAMNLPALERSVKLEGEPAVLLLPEVDGIGIGARMDFSAAPVQSLRVKNLGEGTLELAPTLIPAGVIVDRLSIPGNGETELRVTLADTALESGSAQLILATNDPDRPSVTIELGKNVGGTDPGEPPVIGEDGGCSTGSGQRSGIMLLMMAVMISIRRRRA